MSSTTAFSLRTQLQRRLDEACRTDRQDDRACLHCVVVGYIDERYDSTSEDSMNELFASLRVKEREAVSRFLAGETTYMAPHNVEAMLRCLVWLGPSKKARVYRLMKRNEKWADPANGGKQRIWALCRNLPWRLRPDSLGVATGKDIQASVRSIDEAHDGDQPHQLELF